MFTTAQWIQIIGYSGSFLIALSLSMKSISRLRKINLIGASTFAFYGFLMQAYPVLILNSFIALVDIYYLVQMRRKKDYFELLPIRTTQSPFLLRFLEYHREDIKRFFPEFTFDPSKDYLIAFVLRNLMPVSLFIAKKEAGDTLRICLDYSIPAYRDRQNAHYLYHRGQDFFRNLNYRFLITCSDIAAHQKYLQKMGFQKDNKRGGNWFKKELQK